MAKSQSSSLGTGVPSSEDSFERSMSWDLDRHWFTRVWNLPEIVVPEMVVATLGKAAIHFKTLLEYEAVTMALGIYNHVLARKDHLA